LPGRGARPHGLNMATTLEVFRAAPKIAPLDSPLELQERKRSGSGRLSAAPYGIPFSN
jgi:hypothetical protein